MSKDRFSDVRKDPFFRVDNTLIDNGDCNVYEVAIYTALCRYANNNTGLCYPSLTTIAKKLNTSKNTIIKYIDCLVEKGFIEKKKIYKGDIFSNNHYYIKGVIPLGVVQEMNHPSAGDELGVVQEMNHPSAGDAPYKDSLKNTNIKKTNKKRKDEFDLVNSMANEYTENLELKSMLLNFIEQRYNSKKYVTEIAMKTIINTLNREGKDNDLIKTRMIEKSIMSGWTGVFALNDKEVRELTSLTNTNHENHDNMEGAYDAVNEKWASE